MALPIHPPPSAGPTTWRDCYPPHPCAEVFPLMPDDEIAALAEDISTNGLRHLIVLAPSVMNDPGRRVREGRPELRVLDGRNRLEALARLGVPVPAKPDDPVVIGHTKQRIFKVEYDGAIVGDPAVTTEPGGRRAKTSGKGGGDGRPDRD